MENKFEQLLRNTLSEEESQQLIKEIERDPALKKEFEEYRNAWDLVKTLERRELKEKITQLANEEPKASKKQWIWYAAASIVLLMASYWFFQQPPSGEQMAQTYFKPYPDKFTTMGGNSSVLSQAMTAYNKEDYQEAETLFDQIPEELRNDVELYQGICWYQMDEKKKAKVLFKKLIHDSTNKEPALWYLSLTHLALNEKDSAITILNQIKNDSSITFHKEDAIEIIEQLE